MAIERLTPGTKEWDAYYSNHIMRYQFAAIVLKRDGAKSILDAACGSGFGSHFLSQQVPDVRVMGIDRSDQGLAIARKNYTASNIAYIKDDCHTLSAAGKSGPFDAIVSFETLEHLPRPDDFLKSAISNLKGSGKI